MTAKEYLSQAYWLDKRINSKLSMVASLRETVTKTTGVMRDDVVSHTRNIHSMQDVIVKVIEIERELDADIDRLVDLKHDIINVIGQISDPSAQVVLEYRYVCYRQWKDIASELGMHMRNVYRLHGRGLQETEKILKKNPPDGTICH
ncbi:MAG: DUF1492 domain-containing protein [bacterium]